MNKKDEVAVTSRSFSKNKTLVEILPHPKSVIKIYKKTINVI